MPRVVLLVLAAHALWIGAYFAAGQEARDFIRLGHLYVKFGTVLAERAGGDAVVELDPTYDYPENRDALDGTGYDGQYSYYLALDLENAKYYMDFSPGYRYSRILYPMAARALAAGQADAVPYTLILVNWLAIGAGTLALALWLRRRSCSPWLAAIYGFYPGLLHGLQRDLTEPLAYGLVAIAVLLFDYGGRRRVLWAGLFFGLAALTKQSTAVFALVYAASLVIRADRRGLRERIASGWRDALVLLALALGPIIAWSVYLRLSLGPLKADYIEPLPFLGLIESRPWELGRQPPVIVTVVIPALMVSAVALRALRRHPKQPELHALLLNVLLFVVLLGGLVYSGGYVGVARNASGVVLAALLSVPYLREVAPESRLLRAAPVVLALALFPVLLVYEVADLNFVGGSS